MDVAGLFILGTMTGLSIDVLALAVIGNRLAQIATVGSAVVIGGGIQAHQDNARTYYRSQAGNPSRITHQMLFGWVSQVLLLPLIQRFY
ncbi:MAG: hypothetical protein B6D77_07445 [gamma proteobacterium symbiont of Ctena orbiculata]|nr:MAG: hypothetical protein B6D77_07445 [gamma proteobacterium symbiont of Ctena orbiculata]PVV18677.1 MAG: hypothetical protein B6D78_15570 [gamma proteobacterium symbiont of Ctena orbiculata]PVV26090.1 MAG: hypothetical protein B6D79_07375 [gamma proteobacterium symbiont of Ctena orbiculata]